jgi:hypothetical protein
MKYDRTQVSIYNVFLEYYIEFVINSDLEILCLWFFVWKIS